MNLYILIEIIYLIIVMINLILGTYSEILNIGPILISIIYIIIKKRKGNIYLTLSLFFSLLGDIFFLLIDKNTIGIASFMIVQVCYLYYLIDKSNKISIIVLLNFIITCIFGKKLIIIEVILYALIFIINIILSTIKVKNKQISSLFLLALISLLICDINVAIISKINLSQNLKVILGIIEWTFYTLNLCVITMLAIGLLNTKKVSE